ncbi:hypothetical protein COO60DRAFT_1627150 [Scenedesmus sp. NREL 46B-D3]|nr:hypothetical protein COO60DRAFT_1627150 [Scenedesmus sp. NREL 46B-D3]
MAFKGLCPAGQYPAVTGCRACPVNMYCPVGSDPQPCPNRLVTRGPGAASLRQCANPPGYIYVPSETSPSTAACGKDVYTLGLRFQTECTPCPNGFATNPDNVLGSHKSVSVCMAPPGFRMISSMVAPCGKGTFSSSYSDNYVPCTRCSTVKGPGITTETAGAISVDRCTWVEQGYAAAGDSSLIYLAGAPAGSAIASAKPCPQDHYCSGGSPYEGGSGVPKRCPNGLRTQSQGAVSVDQCVAPPGYYVVPGQGTLAECPDGWYKESWDRSSSCVKCGLNPYKKPDGFGGVIDGSAAGWQSNRNVTLEVLDPSDGMVLRQEPVRGSPECCYLRRGMASQRVFEAATGIWRLQALYCPTSDSYYGLSGDLYGVALVPCFNCAPNMVTSCSGVPAGSAWSSCAATLDAAAVRDASGAVKAYASAAACVLQPGWGWVNVTYGPVNNQVTRAFVKPCPINSFSPGDPKGSNRAPSCSRVTTHSIGQPNQASKHEVKCTWCGLVTRQHHARVQAVTPRAWQHATNLSMQDVAGQPPHPALVAAIPATAISTQQTRPMSCASQAQAWLSHQLQSPW